MLLTFNENGIYCSQANVYIDPWKPVNYAIITHGHSDHARWGHNHYLCVDTSKPILKHRLGPIKVESLPWGATQSINGVTFSFHPAGHIVGSAQVRVEYKGEVWVVSGDYKLEQDGTTKPFEAVRCHTFITESTFGLPIYKWKKQDQEFAMINAWWAANQAEGKVSVVSGYSLGKAQRLLQGIDPSIGQVFTHGAIENVNEVIRKIGIDLHPTTRITPNIAHKAFVGGLVIAPPSAIGSAWMKRFKQVSVGIASGWMALRGARRRRAVDRGFVLSDHADWDGLNLAIEATGAERVFVTHGYTELYARYLKEQGYDAHVVSTAYEGELSEINEGETESVA